MSTATSDDYCVILKAGNLEQALAFSLLPIADSQLARSLEGRIIAHHDLLSIVSRVASEWSIPEVELVSFPTGQLIGSIEDLKQFKVAVARPAADVNSPRYTIPKGPTPFPLIGNIPQLLPYPAESAAKMVDTYGALFPLSIGPKKFLLTADARIAQAIDAKKDCYGKFAQDPAFIQLRRLAGDGLFTASDEEENWGIAHRILIPFFSQKSLRSCLPDMNRLASLLVKKWETINEPVDLPKWMTKVTMDTIAQCGFSYDFKSLESDTVHPFIEAMAYSLEEVMEYLMRNPVQHLFSNDRQAKFEKMVQLMKDIVQKVIDSRKKETVSTNPESTAPPKDFLEAMMLTVDPETGKKMTEANMINNVLTFLIAGHETTASLLSWTIYHLSINPAILAKVRHEVIEACGESFKGNAPLLEKEVGKLKYTLQVIKEALRLHPSVGNVDKSSVNSNTLCGYAVKKDMAISCNVKRVNQNPIYWGDDANEFNPDHFSAEEEATRHPYAFLSFGYGPRSCLGAQFALLESRVILAYIVYYFDFVLTPGSVPVTVQKAALRPENLFINVHPRDLEKKPSISNELPKVPEVKQAPKQATEPAAQKGAVSRVKVKNGGSVPTMTILFGSDMGASQEFAYRLSNEMNACNIKTVVAPLNSYSKGKSALDACSLLIVITSTYNGYPPNNASQFNEWMTINASQELALSNMRFAVFGVGNTQWRSTYQAFPKSVDAFLADHQAHRIVARCEGNVDDGFDVEETFFNWLTELKSAIEFVYDFKVVVSETTDQKMPFSIEASDQESLPIIMNKKDQENNKTFTLKKVNVIANDPEENKIVIQVRIELPAGITYKAGDHLAIYPENSEDEVSAVLSKIIDIPTSKSFFIKPLDENFSLLPVHQPVNARVLIRHCVDLHGSPSKGILKQLRSFVIDEKEQLALDELAEKYNEQILQAHRSLLYVLEKVVPSIRIPLDKFLNIAPQLQARHYSIASSNLNVGNCVDLVIAVPTGPNGFSGFCSSFLAQHESKFKSGTLVGFHSAPKSAFYLPSDRSIPVFMICAGTGIAPYRGFLQELEAIKKTDNCVKQLGPAYLLFGCRHREKDELLKEETDRFLGDGILTARYVAYSRDTKIMPKTYVQDLITREGDCSSKLYELFLSPQAKGIIYVCGSANGLAKGVREAIEKLIQWKRETTADNASSILQAIVGEARYQEDVWG